MLSTITVRIPRVRIEPAHSTTWDADDVGVFVLCSILLVGMAILVVGAALWGFTKLTYRPKTVVKWESSLSMEKQDYISQCEKQDHEYTNDGNDVNNPGIPNTTVNPWTCTYAH